jgi:hypothetical protein
MNPNHDPLLRESDTAAYFRKASIALAISELDKKPEPDVLRKGLMGNNRTRVEFGTVETSLGAVVLNHDQGSDTVAIHGVVSPLADIRRDLRMAIIATSAAFSRAQSDEEQAGQKAALAAVIDAVLREHAPLAAKVRAALQGQRFTNV